MLASSQVKITAEHSRENEDEKYKSLILGQELHLLKLEEFRDQHPKIKQTIDIKH